MRLYKDAEKKILKSVICNCCGRELDMNGSHVVEGVLCIRKDWGFFSKKDLKRHEFDLCENCYDNMIERFQIPVTESEILEM